MKKGFISFLFFTLTVLVYFAALYEAILMPEGTDLTAFFWRYDYILIPGVTFVSSMILAGGNMPLYWLYPVFFGCFWPLHIWIAAGYWPLKLSQMCFVLIPLTIGMSVGWVIRRVHDYAKGGSL